MELKWLEDLIVLLDEQSFSRAAARRNITQSAFSRRIQSLEDWFGCKLVDRNTKPVRLLNNALFIRPHVEELIRQFYNVRKVIKQKNHATNRVIFATQDSLGLSVIPKMAMDLNKKINCGRSNESLIDFSYQMASRESCIKKIEQSEADFLVCYENEFSKVSLCKTKFKNFSWMKDRLIPIGNRKIFNDITIKSSEDVKIPYIAYPSSSFFGSTIALSYNNYDPNQYKLERVCEAESEIVLREMVRSGLGLAWLPRSMIADDLDGGGIIDLSRHLPSYSFDVMVYSSRLVPASIRVFDLLQELSARHMPGGSRVGPPPQLRL